MNKIICKTTFSINNHSFPIHIICEKRKPCNFKNIIKRIYIWLHVATSYASPDCSKILNIYIFLTKNTRKLPETSGTSIDQINVNGAYTFACIPTNQLHIYREEEWFKVFIHETFHSLGLDFAMVDATKSNAEITDIFPLKSDVRISESYCEMWAEIINIMFIAYDTTHIGNNNLNWINRLLTKTMNMLKKEQEMSLFQCAKILDYYGMIYTDLYQKNDAASLNRQTKYKENTHVLSYYIIKSLLMYHVDGFIDRCCDINDNYSINFNKDRENINKYITKYCEFIRKYHDDPIYVKNINDVLKNVLKNVLKMKKKTNNKMILTTLRMTLYDVK
jgi:hypothetical protein